MTDLTKEWLDGLDGEVAEAIAEWGEEDPVQIGDALMTRVALREFRQLIAMAKRTEAAERRATDMERLSRYETNFRETAERERDALRAMLTAAVDWAEGGFDFCFSCSPDENADIVSHEEWCWVGKSHPLLAQPTTDADGECHLCGGTGLRLEDGVHLPCRACNGSAYAPMPTIDAGGAE